MSKRHAKPTLSEQGQAALAAFEHHVRVELDLSEASVRNYLSDIQQFMAWCENDWEAGQEESPPFKPDAVAIPTITAYRRYLQEKRNLRPASINRYLVSIKRYFEWATQAEIINRDPAKPVKLVGEEKRPPRHITDQEEAALVAAVERGGDQRDRTIIILMLHTGLRASEVCNLQRKHITLGKRSGKLEIIGKGNKYRQVPLNATARATLKEYLALVPDQGESGFLFLSTRTRQALTTRALGYIVTKYATRAGIDKISPHDLRHRFGYRMAETVPLHRLAQIMGHDSLDTTMIYIQATARDLQNDIESIAWE